MTPRPQGTPVIFGNSLLLKSVIDGWRATPASNHGVVLIAEELPFFLTGTSFRESAGDVPDHRRGDPAASCAAVR